MLVGRAEEGGRGRVNLIFRAPTGGELWQGNFADANQAMAEFKAGGNRKIDALALCASEAQPPAPPGMLGLRVRLFDKIPADKAEADDIVRRGLEASEVVAGWVDAGQRVCVCCFAGLNRSGLIAGLSMLWLTTLSGPTVVRVIREARGKNALSNSFFEGVLLAVAQSRRA